MSPAADVQAVADHQTISNLVAQYALALDSHSWDELRDVFEPDAVMEFDGPGPRQGIEDIIEVCSGALTALDASQHLIGTVLPRIDGDAAECTSYFQAQQVSRGTAGGETFIVAGRYVDRLRRSMGGGWRIVHRKQVVHWTEGNEQVVFP